MQTMASESTAAADWRPRPGDAARALSRPGIVGRAGRFLATGLVAGLALFHSQLLWQRIADLTLFEPLVALRWSAAVLLAAGFAYLHRAGVSVLWGHKALILWLLVLLCHAGTVAPAEGVHQALAEPGLLLAVSLWGFALRAVLGDLGREFGGAPRRARFLPASRLGRPRRDPRFLEPFSPRPPPAA